MCLLKEEFAVNKNLNISSVGIGYNVKYKLLDEFKKVYEIIL